MIEQENECLPMESYLDILLNDSKEEQEIDAKLDKERKEFESSEAYVAYNKKIKELWDQKARAHMERMNSYREKMKERRSRNSGENSSEDAVAELKELKRTASEKRKTEYDGFPDNVKNIIQEYNNLDSETRNKIRWFLKNNKEEEDAENPTVDGRTAHALAYILGLVVFDFAKAHGWKDVDGVGFYVDAVDSGSEEQEWNSNTDGHIHVTGWGEMEYAEDGKPIGRKRVSIAESLL